jgi:hypothetical protein
MIFDIKIRRILFVFVYFLIFDRVLFSQTVPTAIVYGNFQCDVYLEIYNGLYDWTDNISYSGTNVPLSSGDKTSKGAVTVANLNDTDGDLVDDNLDSEVKPTTYIGGRNEIDLIKIVIKKTNPTAILTGNVELKLNTGVGSFWTKSWKETQLPTTYIFPASELEKTIYFEATKPSINLGDIDISVTYNGKFDNVKATAVWVENTQVFSSNSSFPIPGTVGMLVNLDEPQLLKRLNNLWISKNMDRFGHENCRYSDWKYLATNYVDKGDYDKSFGGRILFEYKVLPVDAGKLVNFDISRQRKTRTYKNKYGTNSFTPDILNNIDFPEEYSPKQNKELPNDDDYGTDEDNTPKKDFIYSADIPAALMRDDPTITIPNAVDRVAFLISLNNFREFARIQIKPSIFTNQNQGSLIGSRASLYKDWYCSYYMKRAIDGNIITKDIESNSFSYPLVYNNKSGNGNINVLFLPTSLPSDVYYVAYSSADNSWALNSDNFDLGLFTFNPSDESWSVTSTNGVKIKIQKGTIPFEGDFTWIFNTFKTKAPIGIKENKIGAGTINVLIDP